ncbi:unnamed protein product [Ixodes persulcatus]
MSGRKYLSGAAERKTKFERGESQKRLPKLIKYLASCPKTSSNEPLPSGSPKLKADSQVQQSTDHAKGTAEEADPPHLPCPLPVTREPLSPWTTQKPATTDTGNCLKVQEPFQQRAEQCSTGVGDCLRATVLEPVAAHGSEDVARTVASPPSDSDECVDLSPQPLEVGSISVESDPAKWPDTVPDKFRTACTERGPQYFQNRSEYYPTSERQYTNQKQYLSPQLFVRKAANGEVFERHWLLYSQSNGSMYCLMCKLFAASNSPFVTHGFCDWKMAEEKARAHEDSIDHRNAVVAWLARSTARATIYEELVQHFVTQRAYWK